MGNRLTPTQGHLGVRPLLLAALMVVTLVLTLGATSASAAKAATCSVKNTDTGTRTLALQQAVDAAKPGAHLVVKGTCVGGTFIDKDIAIAGVATRETGKPVLDGVERARVIAVKPGVRVSIRDLTIRDGRARKGELRGWYLRNVGTDAARRRRARQPDDFGGRLWRHRLRWRHLQRGLSSDSTA